MGTRRQSWGVGRETERARVRAGAREREGGRETLRLFQGEERSFSGEARRKAYRALSILEGPMALQVFHIISAMSVTTERKPPFASWHC